MIRSVINGTSLKLIEGNETAQVIKNELSYNRNVVTCTFLICLSIDFGKVFKRRVLLFWGAFDSAKNHKRQRRKRQSVTAKREKSQTPKFV